MKKIWIISFVTAIITLLSCRDDLESSANVTIINKSSHTAVKLWVAGEFVNDLPPGVQCSFSYKWESGSAGPGFAIVYTLNGVEYGNGRFGELWDKNAHPPYSYSVKPYNNYPEIRNGSNGIYTITNTGYTLKGSVYIWKDKGYVLVSPDDPAYLD
ncbi:MAG: hypothetical protein Ta2F_09850 [Termitinemataceae bacterium]|nr:MAG: hypothetical protein Ta2F_09850 [Termitinemataceae bacterium]